MKSTALFMRGAEEEKARDKERQKRNEQRAGLINDKRTELGMASIAWMRVAKRIGQSAGLRAIFKEVRSDKWVCWQVFEGAGASFYLHMMCRFAL